MGIEEILGLLGGLALFLWGMDSMGDGLEAACGDKMKSILEKLTSNRFIGVLVGAAITAVIQSSSATTVMVVGFVNAGMMTLSQAIWIIMGANIGTTVTGLLIAFDVGVIAPIVAVIGVVMMLFIKKPMVNEIGKILAGFGILFIGMDMMSGSMAPLRDNEMFINLMTSFSNPLLGILAGAIFTAVIQSSSASVGILQALAMSGAIGLESAVFVLFGMNIGTCVTALLASISANRAAKRTTLIHFFFNIIGTVIFTIICLITPLVDLLKLNVSAPAMQIANMHTIFNVVTTLLLIPFGLYLVKLVEKIMPDREVVTNSAFMYLKNDINMYNVGASSLQLENIHKEIRRMHKLAFDNIKYSFSNLLNHNLENEKKIRENEDLIDDLYAGITKYVTAHLHNELNYETSRNFSACLALVNDIERLGDHALNINKEVKILIENNHILSEEAINEVKEMGTLIYQMFDYSLDNSKVLDVKAIEASIDKFTYQYKENMFNRLKEKVCTAEGSISYSTLLINFERIGDHLLNISESSYAMSK